MRGPPTRAKGGSSYPKDGLLLAQDNERRSRIRQMTSRLSDSWRLQTSIRGSPRPYYGDVALRSLWHRRDGANSPTIVKWPPIHLSHYRLLLQIGGSNPS